jgi:hypothetical protein
MPTISTADAQALFTKALVDVYVERIQPKSFLRSFFTDVVTGTKEVSIEVQRGKELVAVDVVRGTDGNRNEWKYSSEKIFIPPYFREWMDATQLQLYDRLYGATEINDVVFSQFINDVADKLEQMQEKIDRAYELMCASVFETGVVTIEHGTDVDFKRKSASIVDLGAGQYFANAIDPFKKIEAGCNFIRTKGKNAGNVFNLILGSDAISDLMTNTIFTNRQNLVNMSLDAVREPQKNSVGGVLHGQITCGSYRVNLWTYPEFYDTTAGVATPYIDAKKAILLPEAPKFKMAYAAVPQLLEPNTLPRIGKYIVNEYIDKRGKSMIIDIESAALPIPTAVDTIYTMKCVA